MVKGKRIVLSSIDLSDLTGVLVNILIISIMKEQGRPVGYFFIFPLFTSLIFPALSHAQPL